MEPCAIYPQHAWKVHGKRNKEPKSSRARGALTSRATPQERSAPIQRLLAPTLAAETTPATPK
eukprot:3743775-Prymnesium_polylepis.1